MTRQLLGTAAAAVAVVTLAATGCTAGDPAPAPPPAGGTSAVGSPSASYQSPAASSTPVPEPTTTNTLPPPPEPRTPEPSTSGPLTARSLPVPRGWRTVVREGGAEEGYQGNGTWTNGRDPRYAAQDTVTIGCADVTRDDYTDQVAALEGTYESRAGRPGVGLALQFGTTAAAQRFWTVYQRQVAACTDPDGPVLITTVRSGETLFDRRTYPDSEWTEVGRLAGRRLTLVILSDPGHKIRDSQAAELLEAIKTSSGR